MRDRMAGLLADIGRVLEPEEFDPRFKKPNRASDAPLSTPVVQARETIPMKPLSLSELEGFPYLTTMSDRTAAGGQLVGVGDKSLAYPVNLTGGQDFMRDFTQNPNLWASAEGVVPKMVTAARELEGEYGRQPVFMPWSMTPTGSDFSGMTGKTMFSYASENMPQTFKKEVDAHMKLYVPDWKGIDNPESGAQFDALPDKARKKAQGYMDTKFRNVGGITLPQTRIAIADQSQLNQPVMGFKNVGLIDTSVDALAGAGNPTYPSALAGKYMGTLDTDVTAIDLNPNRYARKRKADGSFFEDPQGKDFLSTKTAPRRSMEVNYYGGLIDDALLRSLDDRGFKVKSGLLPTAATLGTAAMSLLGSEEADAAIIPKLAQTTQRANTVPTAKAADKYLTDQGATGKSLDYGAGFGINAKAIGFDDTFEPFADDAFKPTYTSAADIPENTYGKVVSTNVLNVIPPDARAEAIQNIGSILEPNGMAVIQTRSASAVNELKKSKTAIPQDEPASFLTSKGSYQKGFTRDELQNEVQGILGDNFEVTKIPSKDIPNGSAISVKKLRGVTLPTAVAATGLLGGQEEAEASGFGGFALKALERTQRKNPTTASGWKNALKGQGVKPKELQLMGFDNEFGFRKPDITKDEVAEFLKNNEYKIRETVLTDQPRYTVKRDYDTGDAVLYNPDGSVNSRYATMHDARVNQFELNENVLTPEHEEFQLSPDDSENYRELLLKDDVNATKHEEITQEIKNLNDFIDAREDQLYDSILDAGGGQSELLKTKLDDPQVLDATFKIAKLQQDRAELPYPFLTSHFDGQENILSHLRVADRQAVDDSNTLMVEEIQSDMHQRGSKVGYSKQPEINAMRDRRDALQEESDKLTRGKWSITGWAEENMPEELDKLYTIGDQSEAIAGAAGRKILEARNKAYRQEFGESFIDRLGNVDRQLDNLRDKLTKAEIAVPDMPFKSGDKSSWYDLAFKRALVDAAEGDYDSISFTTGKTQGERWKGAADIKGVVNFYDNTLKNHINNWAKQYGVKLTPTKLKAKNKGYEVFYDENDVGWEVRDDDNIRVNADVNTEREAYEWIADKTGQEVLTLPITDKMRKELKDKGVSLFSNPLVSGVAGAGVVGAATRSPVADANEARTQGLLQNMASRRDIAERAGAVPDLTAGLLEQTGRDIINFGAGVINPDYGDIAEGGMFPVTEKGEAALTKAGEVFMDKVAPTLVKVGRGLLDDQPMFGGTLREQLGMVRDQYNKLPEGVREEVTPRLGYAGLLALTLSPAAKPVKKAIKKRKKTKQE